MKRYRSTDVCAAGTEDSDVVRVPRESGTYARCFGAPPRRRTCFQLTLLVQARPPWPFRSHPLRFSSRSVHVSRRLRTASSRTRLIPSPAPPTHSRPSATQLIALTFQPTRPPFYPFVSSLFSLLFRPPVRFMLCSSVGAYGLRSVCSFPGLFLRRFVRYLAVRLYFFGYVVPSGARVSLICWLVLPSGWRVSFTDYREPLPLEVSEFFL